MDLLGTDNSLTDNQNNQFSQALWLSDLNTTHQYIINNAHYINNNKDGLSWTKEQGAPPETKEQEETNYDLDKGSKVSLGGRNLMCHSTITVKQSPSGGGGDNGGLSGLSYSYTGSSVGGTGTGEGALGAKVEMVYNLLSMLGTHDRAEMTNTLLAMSTSPDSCHQMRHSGCLSLLVQLVHASGESNTVRARAAQALRNMVLCGGDDRRGRREARVLRLLDQLIAYCDLVQDDPSAHTEEAHPGPAIAALMKLSFDEEHRLAMCQLGALYVIARLIQVEANEKMECCVTVKRYGGMALTNLTFGDGNNKALLCSMRPFMNALVAQLNSNSEDLIQVTASVLRNLSWRADAPSKLALREVGAVTALMRAAMQGATKEPTLKSVLSALWNLSAHCNANKVDICAVDGALQYLVEMLSYQSNSKTLAVVENAGGILRNISSHIAVREDYRKILRDGNCLVVLLRQLQSASLTVVSNACGTLWNLSARCAADQRALVALGAVPMLTSLAHSKHRMIAMGAGAALKNLLPVRLQHHHQTAAHGGATLLARKKRALEAELNSTLGETCDNIEPGATWEVDDHDSNVPQTKDECEQINRSMKEINIEETTEQPVDYSLKYRETENRNVTVDNDTVNYKMKYSEEKDEKVLNGCFTNAEVNTEGDYAETDLDQLTDYSLRYSEEQLPEGHEPQEPVEGTESRPSEPLTPAEVATSPEKHDTGKGGVLETPLMFSRSSSLGSLSSCEQANDDCQSSVVSEFSRMTSGIMSPSELPDSPTQTVPPSPRTKVPIIPAVVKEEKIGGGGVFDDTVLAFKEESTPAQFSTATSLSDLTIDDELNDGVLDRKELELPVVSEEEDEHVLADCIKSGMQDNRDVVDSIENRNCGIPRARGGIPVKSSIPRPNVDEVEGDQLSRATSNSELSLLSDQDDNDNILQQCIESAMPQSAIPKKKVNQLSPAKIPTATSGVKVPLKSRSIPPPSSRMRQIVTEDEVSVFATEGSPCNFSARSSLSDLTINTRPTRSGPGSPPHELSSPLSSLEPDVSAGEEGEAVTVVSAASVEDPILGDQDDQALLMQVISSGMHSVSDTLKASDSWPDDTTLIDAPSVSLSAPNTFNSHRDGVVELETGGVALISHLELESVEPPSNMASITSLGGISMGSGGGTSLGCSLDAAQPMSFGCSLDAVQPPSLLDSILSLSSAAPCRDATLLDNVRPPAEMDEVLDLDNSITSVASISSEIVDDLPKCLRTTQDTRFNTYKVVRERKGSGNGQDIDIPNCDDIALIEIMKRKDKIKQRRQAEKDRFKTRTILNPVNDFLRLSSVDGSEDSINNCSSQNPSEHSEPHCEALGPTVDSMGHSFETSGSVETSVHSVSSDSHSDEPPRPIVTKPPEMKSIRGGGKGSGIPVVRSPVKSAPAAAGGKRKGAPVPLQRQGTFTKEEPCSSIPLPVKKTIASPLKKQSHIPSAGAGLGRGRASSLPSKGNGNGGGASGGGVRASASNQSLKAAAEGKAPAQRWHSNSSLNSAPQASQAPAKQPASKIASLWKKVDDSKKKQSLAKDTRVWIPPNPSQ